MKIKYFCLICSITLVACGKNSPNNTAIPATPAANPTPISQPTGSPSGAIKIKGLYIGMNIQDASAAMKEIITKQNLDKFEVMDARKVAENSCVLMIAKDLKDILYNKVKRIFQEDELKEVTEKFLNEVLDDECHGNQTETPPALAVWSDAEGQVNQIYFNNFDDIFNVKGLPIKEFMQHFIDSYSIPEMKANGDGTGWIYVSPEGTKVEARAVELKGEPFLAWIHISKVAGTKEIKQGFN